MTPGERESGPPEAEDAGDAPPSRRRLARLAALQALYQAEMNRETAEAVSAQFLRYRLGRDIEGIRLDADRRFFDRLLRSVAEHRRDIDSAVSAALARNDGLGRLEPVLRAALRLGAAELLYQTDVPPRVAIREYTDLVGDFFDEPQARFATAVFDRIAHSARPGELDGPAA
ncbi:MAG: transcription antitermination factor NusB [Alphaproteobacteria bacterium]|nr:transcription antitermination factor NusB [Alphaproteobacteria bacterium]